MTRSQETGPKRTGQRARRAIAVVAAVSATMIVAVAPGDAAPRQAAEPEITVSAQPALGYQAWDCSDNYMSEIQPGAVTIARSGDTTSALEVDVTWAGTLLDNPDLPPLPDPVTIAAGTSSTTIELAGWQPNQLLTVELVPGDGYVVGSPSTAIFSTILSIADPNCAFARPIVQTIAIGTAPDPLDDARRAQIVDGAELQITGDLPPGLTYLADGTWAGVATEVGTTTFRIAYCEDGFCPVSWWVRITVIPADAPVPVTAPPARPIAGQAAFTG